MCHLRHKLGFFCHRKNVPFFFNHPVIYQICDVLNYVCIHLPSIIKMQLYLYKFVKSRIDKKNNIWDVKYITIYTNFMCH